MKIALCGANSNVGQNLLAHVLAAADITAVAMVRSQRAADALPASDRIRPVVADYEDAAELARHFEGVDAVVHLAGVLFEARGSSYARANVATTAAVVAAAKAAGAGQVIFISALGAASGSANPYLRSKGEAEDLVRASGLPGTILRTPMLLGPGSAAASALLRSASRSQAWVLGGGRQMLRPLDLDDLSRAILNVVRQPPGGVATWELTGPEPITQEALIRLMGSLQGRSVRVRAVPVGLAKSVAAVVHAVTGGGASPAVIDVITAQEQVAENGDAKLGIELTPLQATLGKLIGNDS
ncbi:MAG: NAD(P)H-binding protein [Gammaproteobacteria bacterium]|nr:NAD(P)H-binding protein [Gammaproteobacteria bacterium]